MIRTRTESGTGVKRTADGGFRHYKFPAYSKAYKESLDFAIAGKTTKVDLTLSGDMLAALDVLGHSNGSITVGYEAGTEENDRAEGNQKGSYGGRPRPSKARSFLGITQSELDSILEKYERRRV